MAIKKLENVAHGMVVELEPRTGMGNWILESSGS